MPLPFSRLQLTTALPPSNGLSIQSPASGIIQSLSKSTEAAAAAGFFGEGIQLLLQGTELRAPFDGIFTRQDAAGQQLRFYHANGLQLDIHFPPQCINGHGRGFDWQQAQLAGQNIKVTAGQLVLNFDPALLNQWVQPLSCIITLKSHPRFGTIWCRSGYHDVWQDKLFLIELTPGNNTEAA
jgi:phosphotransferase system IIA component